MKKSKWNIQNNALKQVLKQEKSVGASLRNLKRLASENVYFRDTQHDVQSYIFEHYEILEPIIRTQFTKKQQERYDEITVKQFRLYFDDELIKAFDTEEKAESALLVWKKRFIQKNQELLTVKPYDKKLERSFRLAEILKITQKISDTYDNTYENSDSVINIVTIKKSLSLPITDKDKKAIKIKKTG